MKELNSNTSTQISTNDQLTEEVPISLGIREGDSLSPMLFKLIIYKIIDYVKNSAPGYQLITGETKLICYADDAVIVSDNKDDLQRLLHAFYKVAQRYNMTISKEKTKSLVIATSDRKAIQIYKTRQDKNTRQIGTTT